MKQKSYLIVILLILSSMILSACSSATATQDLVVLHPPNKVANAQPTAVPLTEVAQTPQPAPDIAVLYAEMIVALPQGYAAIKPTDLNTELASATPPFMLDVRETTEVATDGYIKGAVNIPVRTVLKNLDKLPGIDSQIVIYCDSGQRSGILLGVLRVLGYTNVYNLGGGLSAWKKANLPVETGSTPAAAQSISTPIIANKALYTKLDESMSSIPDGFLSLKGDKAVEAMAGANPPTLVDLRTPEEVTQNGWVKGSINIPVVELFTSLDKLPAKDAPFMLYCVSGQRGAIAIEGLRLLGYTNVLNIGGGFDALIAAGLQVEGVVDWVSVWKNFLSSFPDDYYLIKSDALKAIMDAGNVPFLIDVRDASEVADAGYIKGAVNIPIRVLLRNLDKLPGLDTPIVVYSGVGHRGTFALTALRLLGYTGVRSLAGGFDGWKAASMPLESGAPPEPTAGKAATVDPIRLKDLDNFLFTLPDGFYSMGEADFKTVVESATPPLIIDVRSAEDFVKGHIPGAVNIPIKELLNDMTKLPVDKSKPIITVCTSGHRGAIAVMALSMLGYTNVTACS